jgi:hypothetical protein
MHPASVIWTPTPLLTERSIINFLIWIGGLILGPYLAITLVEFNFYPTGVFVGVCALAIVFGFLRDRICILPLVGCSIVGRINLIPVLHPAPVELFPLVMILYYLIAYTALQRKKVLAGPPYFFIPILILAFITLYHEHSFGLRSMNTGKEGGRPAIFIMVAAITYFCGISLNSPSARFLSLTPLFCLVASVISAIPYTVTTYFPSTATYFFIFTDNINTSAYAASQAAGTDIVRHQGQAEIGAQVMTVLLAYFPVYTWWRPHRLWVGILALGCVALVVMGGFRSGLAVFGLTAFVAIWCHISWRALLFIPVAALAVILVTELQNNHAINLPESAQRSLAFLPGNWDPDVLNSTSSSNDFRSNLQKVYLREEAAQSPLLGNGLSYDSADFVNLNYLAMTQETPDDYYLSKEFVMSKQFHSGWMSLYDAVGLIGFAAFLMFTVSLVWVCGRTVFSKKANRKSQLFPLKVWMFSNIFASLVGYFTVFGDFKFAFPGYCCWAIVWFHLNRIEKDGYRAPLSLREVPFDPARAGIPSIA